MKLKTFKGLLLTTLLLGTLTLAFSIQSTEAESDNNLIIDGTTVTLWGNLQYDVVEIRNGGTLIVDAFNGTDKGWINITAASITVDSTSKINGNGLGKTGGASVYVIYTGASGNAGQGPGAGGGGGHGSYDQGGGGAGYGGNGGQGGGGYGYPGGSGGGSYGINDQIGIEMGSGGGSGGASGGESLSGSGGNGGALIRLTAPYMNIFGNITTNGGNGGNGWANLMGSSGGGGGGSGGGILLVGRTINITGSYLTATGGNGGNPIWTLIGTCGGAGGGGGRIKIFYASNGNFYNISSSLAVKGGTGNNGGQNGGDGTIYHNQTDLQFEQSVEIPIKGGENATIVSNVTITNTLVTKNTLHFDASGPTGSTGWINVTFPMINTTKIKVFIDGNKLTPPPFPIITTNGTHYFIYFEFTMSTHSIDIQFAPTSVGGIYTPVNKLELLAPYIGLTILLAVAVITVGYIKKRKRNTRINARISLIS